MDTQIEHYYGNKYELMGTFLKFFRDIGVISAACKKSGISKSTFYRWYDNDIDGEFRVNYEAAVRAACEKNKKKLLNVPKHKRAMWVNFELTGEL